ncbi:MAG: hypothetical protein ACXWAC_14370 [Usitatibacter sp.]
MNLAPSLALILTALASLAPDCARAESGVGARGVAARLDFAIVIPAFVRVKGLRQPDQIAIGEAHVAQGYIDVDDASSLLLSSNGRGGYHLSVAFDAGMLERVLVRIAGQRLEITNGSGDMDVRAARLVDAPVRASYRLYLKPGLRAGNYRWPVSLTFSTRVVA